MWLKSKATGHWQTAKSSYHDYFAALPVGLLREGLAGDSTSKARAAEAVIS
jgi:hypothetical protein